MNLNHYFQLKNHIHQIYQLKLLIVQFLYLLHSIIFQQNFHKFLYLFLLYNFFHKVNILNKINLLILEIFLNILLELILMSLLLFFHRELLYNMLYLCIYNIFLNLEKAIYFNSFFYFNVIYFDILHLMELLLLLYIEMVMFVFFQ